MRAILVLGLVAACAGPDTRGPLGPPTLPPTATSVRIGTWNVLRLGHGDKRLDLVAEVIERELDVVALEEVMTAGAVGELLAELPGWRAAVSAHPVGRDGYEEYYAVLYREAAARVTRSFVLEDRRDDLVREPFVACLVSGTFDFCLVAFHAIYGKTVQPRDEEIEALGLYMMDLRVLGPEQDWIVLGDFNRPHTSPGFGVLSDAGYTCALGPEPIPTTLGLEAYSKPYDHLLVDGRVTRELEGQAVRYDLVAGVCATDFAWCRDEVSDHAPVIARFATAGPDDD